MERVNAIYTATKMAGDKSAGSGTHQADGRVLLVRHVLEDLDEKLGGELDQRERPVEPPPVLPAAPPGAGVPGADAALLPLALSRA